MRHALLASKRSELRAKSLGGSSTECRAACGRTPSAGTATSQRNDDNGETAKRKRVYVKNMQQISDMKRARFCNHGENHAQQEFQNDNM
jgi:hypothetical protein